VDAAATFESTLTKLDEIPLEDVADSVMKIAPKIIDRPICSAAARSELRWRRL
jgi:hypothetical protein